MIICKINTQYNETETLIMTVHYETVSASYTDVLHEEDCNLTSNYFLLGAFFTKDDEYRYTF